MCRHTANHLAIAEELWKNRYLTIQELVDITGQVSKTKNPQQLVRSRILILEAEELVGHIEHHFSKLCFLSRKGLDHFWTEHRVGDGETDAPASGGYFVPHDNDVKQIRLAVLGQAEKAGVQIKEESVYTHGVLPRSYRVKWDWHLLMETHTSEGRFFFEYQHTRKRSYKERMRDDLEKARLYIELTQKYKEPFRVPFVYPTEKRALNFAADLHKEGGEFNRRRFWITSFDQILKDPFGKIWLTPKDYETERYSLLDI